MTSDRTFWRWFVDNAQSLLDDEPTTAMERIQTEVDRDHTGVIVEIGEQDDGQLLVLSANGDRSVFPTVLRLVAEQPPLDGWSVVAFRPRAAVAMSRIASDDWELEPAQIRYIAVKNGEKLDLDLYIPKYTSGNESLDGIVLIVLDHTVGEYDVGMKIGTIGLHALADAPERAALLAELTAEIDELGSAARN